MPFTGLLCKQPPYGGIRAIDMASGKTIWDRPLAQGAHERPVRHPLDAAGEDRHAQQRRRGGDARRGLIFVAAATDNLIRAIDLRTGRTLWKDVLRGGRPGHADDLSGERQAVSRHLCRRPPLHGDAGGRRVVAYALP